MLRAASQSVCQIEILDLEELGLDPLLPSGQRKVKFP